MDAARHRPWKAVRLALSAAGLAVLGAAGPGCNLVIGDYSVVGTHWACVGSVTQPAGVDGEHVRLTIVATPFTAGDVLPPLTIRACDRNDAACTPALATATSGTSGEATITVPSGFQGYFDATAPGEMQSLVYLSWPLVADARYPLPVGSYAEYKALVTAVGGTVIPGSGALWVNTEDCLGQPAAGVTLSLDPMFAENTDAFYFLGGVPVSAQAQGETSPDAVGGFADVMRGRPTISASLSPGGAPFASFPVYVRSSSLTVVWLQPTPAE